MISLSKNDINEFEINLKLYFNNNNILDNFTTNVIASRIVDLVDLNSNKEFELLKLFRNIKKTINEICRKYYFIDQDLVYKNIKVSIISTYTDLYIRNQINPQVYFKVLKESYIPLLLKHNKKTSFKYANKKVIELALKFNLLIATNNLTIYEDSTIKTTNNKRYFDLNNLYNFNKEIPNYSEVTQIIKNQSELTYLALPIEVKGISKIKQKNIYNTLKNISDETMIKPSLIISSYKKYNDYLYWYFLLKQINKENRVGIVLQKFNDIYEIEAKPLIDLIVIDYHKLSQGIDTTKHFKEDVIYKLRIIRAIARENNIKITIKSDKLKNQEIIEKLYFMGFKEYAYEN